MSKTDPRGKARQSTAPPPKSAASSARWGIPLLIAAAVLAVFLQAGTYEFVSWDDNVNIVNNDDFKPTTAHSLARYWSAPKFYQYIPLTYTVWGLLSLDAYDPVTREINPTPYHALNVLLHLGSALLVFALLMELGTAKWAAGAGALLFAIHPLQVEPVVWATGTKDVLSGLLGFIAVWCYVRFVRSEGSRQTRTIYYTAGLTAFFLAMLSKPGEVTLPIAAAALALFILKRGFRQTTLDLLPWIGLAAILSIIAARAQGGVFAAAFPTKIVAMHYRPVLALDAIAWYVYKLFFPVHLIVDYGRTSGWVLKSPLFYITWICPAALAVTAWLLRRRAPWVMAGLLIFLAALAPVLGIVPFVFQRFSNVADRYAYAGMLGPALIVAFVLTRWKSRAVTGITIVILVALAIRSAAQVPYWQDTDALFTHAAEVNPRSDNSLTMVGLIRVQQGRLPEAKDYFRQVVQLYRDDARDRIEFASRMAREGQTDTALQIYKEVVIDDPTSVDAHYQLGDLLASRGDNAGALQQFAEVLKIDPNHQAARQRYLALQQKMRP